MAFVGLDGILPNYDVRTTLPHRPCPAYDYRMVLNFLEKK